MAKFENFTLILGADYRSVWGIFYNQTGTCIKLSLSRQLAHKFFFNLIFIIDRLAGEDAINLKIACAANQKLDEALVIILLLLKTRDPASISLNNIAQINLLEACALEFKLRLGLANQKRIFAFAPIAEESFYVQRFICQDEGVVAEGPIETASLALLKVIQPSDYLCGLPLANYHGLTNILTPSQIYGEIEPSADILMDLANKASYNEIDIASLEGTIAQREKHSEASLPFSDLTLVLDATKGLRVIIFDAMTIHFSQSWSLHNQGTEILVPILYHADAIFGLTKPRFSKIACVLGPGSFTGIRLALTTAQALARCSETQLCGINSLAALCLSAKLKYDLPEGSVLWAVTSAYRNLFHLQKYLVVQDSVCPQTEPILAGSEQLAQSLDKSDYLCGDGLVKNLDLQNLVLKDHFLNNVLEASDQALVRLAKSAIYTKKDLEPLYVRPCDAVDNLERLAIRQGLKPDEAKTNFEHILHNKPSSSI